MALKYFPRVPQRAPVAKSIPSPKKASIIEEPQPSSPTERRIWKRKKVALRLVYRLMSDETGKQRDTSSLDISVTSVAFESPDLIPLGSALVMDIHLPSREEPIKVEGFVNRGEEIEKSRSYFYSMTFHQIREQDRKVLEKIVQLVDIDSILRLALEKEASDVHLVANLPPVIRVHGDLVQLNLPPLSGPDLTEMLLLTLSPQQQAEYEQNLELNCSYFLPEGARFRVNVHSEKGLMEAAFRLIPREIKTFAELGLPPVTQDLCQRRSGLIVICGPTGSGKSTSLAAMVESINQNRSCMIISIEDPIEYVHDCKQSIIKQREVGLDTHSFHSALKNVLRQDPDVILVGEIRDLESISMALTAAETGHLVLTSLHSSCSTECINRMIDAFPAPQQEQVRRQLAGCLEGILTQRLLPSIDGRGMALATEVLVANSAVRNLITESKLSQINSYIETGTKLGMHTMDRSLIDLVGCHRIDRELAKGFMKHPDKLGV